MTVNDSKHLLMLPLFNAPPLQKEKKLELPLPVFEKAPQDDPVHQLSLPVFEKAPLQEDPVHQLSLPVFEKAPQDDPVHQLSLPVFEKESLKEETQFQLSLPVFEKAPSQNDPVHQLPLPVFEKAPQDDPVHQLSVPVFEKEALKEETQFQLPVPVFEKAPLQEDSLRQLPLPVFEKEALPEETQLQLPLPSFEKTPLQEDPLRQLPLPVFENEALPEETQLQLPLPSFEKSAAPQAETHQLNLPSFESLEPLPSEPPFLPNPLLSFKFNPILKQFDALAKHKSYEEILHEAVKFGSLGDIRMLNHQGMLKKRYFNTVFEHLIAEIPFILRDFYPSMENSEKQFALWNTFCTTITRSKCIEDLKDLLPVDRFVEPRPHTQYVDEAHAKGLLQLKDFAHSFLYKIVEHEIKGAVKKDLKGLDSSVAELGVQIQSEFDALRLRTVLRAADLDFSKHEAREPLKPNDSSPPYKSDRVDQNQLEKDLLAIQQEKPRAPQLIDFTNRVLSFPDPDIKAKYLLKLAQVYATFNTWSALKLAVSWVDQAILCSTDKKQCYEIRGALRLQMSQVQVRSGAKEIRKLIDLGYRDFHASLALKGSDVKNYVRSFHQEKQIDAALETDVDYAEAHYVHFLKQLENCSKMLSDQFAYLREVSAGDSLERFRLHLLHKCREKNGSHFKLTLAGGTAWIKFEGDALFIHSSDQHILQEMLTNGIKKVELEKRPYFGQKITQEEFYQTAQSLNNTAEIEKCLACFNSFELSAFYKSSLREEEQNRDSILSRLDYDLQFSLLNLHAMAIRGSKKAVALAHACRAISLCDRLIKLYPKDEALKAKKLEFLIKKGVLYKQLELKNNEVEAWEEAFLFAKKENARFFNPSLHYTLACAYDDLNLIEEAKEQLLYILKSPWGRPEKSLVKKAEKKLAELKNGKDIKDPDPVPLLTRFQDRNIVEECLQILRAHHKANSLNFKSAPIWESFIQQVNKTATVKQFCEVILSSVHLSDKVTPENLLLIAEVSNLKQNNTKYLDQIKQYTLDAVSIYKEIEAREEDFYIEELEKAKQKVQQVEAEVEAFFKFKKALKVELKKGKNIVPGSSVQFKLETLSAHLACNDAKYTLDTVRSLFSGPDFNNPFVDGYFNDQTNLPILVQELSEILESSLNTEVSYHPEGDVLRITGRNIFLSKIMDRIKMNDPSIRDVHIIGVNVYVDTGIELKGVNLAIGGQSVEFLKDKNGAKLKIDLSGKDGEDAPAVSLEPAPKGSYPGQEGGKGADGKDAKGGDPGGDLCVSADEPLVGEECIENILLNGGRGGAGSKGQGGGKGANGNEGEDARTDIRDGDYAQMHAVRYVDYRGGTKGGQGGDGGKGGDAGTGGDGGAHGFLVLGKKVNAPIEKKKGDPRGDGAFGPGGEPGAGGAEGLSHVKTRKQVQHFYFFTKKVDGEKSDIGLLHQSGDICSIENYKGDGRTKDQTRVRGQSKGRGKTVQEQGKKQIQKVKQGLKQQLFAANLSKHLHKELPENRDFAFDSVTNQLALVKDTEEILKDQCAEKKKKLKDIDNLRETAKTILNQTQSEKTVQTERLASYSGGKKIASHAANEIAFFLTHPEKDKENLLPYHLSSKFHPAMYAVNKTKGKNMHAIAHLLEEMTHFEPQVLLVEKIEEILKNTALKDAVDGFDEILTFTSAISHQYEQVTAFKQKLKEEKEALEKAYEDKGKKVLMEVGIHQFLLRKGDQSRFKEMLHRKVIGFAKHVYKKEATPEIIAFYRNYGLEKKASDRKSLSNERTRLQRHYKTLRRNKEWIVEHLSEFDFSPKSLLKTVKIEDLYLECSKRWTNISVNVEEKIEVTEEAPAEESSFEWDWLRKKGNRDPRLEALVKTLYDSGVKEEKVYDELLSLYNDKEFTELAEIYAASPSFAIRKLKTDKIEEVYAWRQRANGELLSSYLEKRHIALTLKDLNKEMEPFLQKANRLYQFHHLVPADFLNIAKQIVLEYPQIGSQQILEEMLLNRSVEGLSFERTTHNLIYYLSRATKPEHWKPCLFLLASRNLNYVELVKIIEIAKQEKFDEEMLTHFNKKAEEEKIMFELRWQAALERARSYDQLIKGSIEPTLIHLAQGATLFSNEKKIDLLSEIMEILASNGPYSTLEALKPLIVRMGQIPSANEYNSALEAVLVKGEKTDLAPLWMKILHEVDITTAQALVAINHIPLKAEELIAFYKKCSPLRNQIKTLLAYKLGVEAKKRFSSKKLIEKQREVLGKFSDLINYTQILHADLHIAKFGLWIHLLDIEAQDTEEIRMGLYDAALKVFVNEMQTKTAEEATTAFSNHLAERRPDLTLLKSLTLRLVESDKAKLKLWTDFLNAGFALKDQDKAFYQKALAMFKSSEGIDDFNRWMNEKYPGAIAHDEAIFAQLKKEDPAADELDNRYWHGLIPYSSEKDEPSIVKLLEGKEASMETAMLLKRKFDTYMLHDDCNHMREKVQAAKKKEQGEFTAWIAEIQTWLLSQAISAEQLEKYYPLDIQTKGEKPPVQAPPDQKMEPSLLPKYLEELEERIKSKSVLKEDALALKSIKNVIDTGQLEDQLIALEDQKSAEKNQTVEKFLQALPFTIAADHPLHTSLSACSAMMGDEFFLPLLAHMTDKHLNPEMFHQLFWVMPRMKNRNAIIETIEERLPENWALSLLEWHCLEMLENKKVFNLADLDLKNLTPKEKDRLIADAVRKQEKEWREFVKGFQNSLSTLIAAPDVHARDKELLLRLFGERLSSLKKGEMEFSLEEFARLIGPDYLLAEGVIKKLFQSSTSGRLAEPLFQSFKYVITHTWIEAELEVCEPRLIEALIAIETVKKEQAMRSVIAALKGSFLTPAVTDAVAHFADGSWELDDETLMTLKNRKSDGEWYAEIEKYTREKRSKERDLETLINLMAEEKKGINSAIQDFPKLLEEVQEIRDQCKLVSDWTQEQIRKWALENRSPTFMDDPKRLIMGIALVSRASKLTGSFPLRDTQLIALWLMLREGKGDRGRIAQMFTGEGKSITFAGLAILRAMNGSPVDVITTSYLLAMRDAKENESLFELFNLTVANNCDLECEANEEERKKRYMKDIIYGDVGCFERDLLLTEFHGKEIVHQERLQAKRSVLVDEVDGLFLDNASMVLYLSHNVDSLRFLTRIFEQIWILASQAQSVDDKIAEAIIKAVNAKIDSEEILLPGYKAENAKYIEMKSVIQRKLAVWVRSALYAKTLRVDKEYIITDQVIGGRKKKTVTVMDMGTGVEQFSLKWSNGLHQFLQLKHALELGEESLKAVFLSNYFYFKRYGANIYGLSGTLGSDIEQTYLRDLYQVDLCKIPRFKGEKYIQHKAQVAGTWTEWVKRIENSVDKQIKENKRAALIICQSVEEVLFLQKRLKEEYPGHHIYTSSLQELPFLLPKDPTLVKPGDLIIATNLAGRGTDLKTDSLLEANGGLHVILSYLPNNIRIQDQAFGRTARSGNEGSGEFIVMDPECRPIAEQCSIRDLEEKKRLEGVAAKEVKKIEFEHDLLRGFDGIEGFESLLARVKKEFEHEHPFYREAQLNSLKNRWAFWLDYMEEKITLVYTLGRNAVIASYKEFLEGVRRDIQAGGFHLIKEPVELIKLGGEYRREKMWSKAEECCRTAAKDPQSDYARYYMAFCRFAQAPDKSLQAKKDLKKEVKKAALSMKNEISHLQSGLQNIVDLAERRRMEVGEKSYGAPYKERTEEKMQIWSIFLSSIDSAIGGSITGDSLKTSSFVKNEEEGTQILKSLGDHYKSARISKKFDLKGTEHFPEMFKPALNKLKGVKDIDKQKLQEFCGAVFTQANALSHLGSTQEVHKFSPLPPSYKGEVYTPAVKFVLSEIVQQHQREAFATHEEMIAKLEERKKEHPILKSIDMRSFFALLVKEKDHKIDLSRFVKADKKFPSYKTLKETGFTDEYRKLPPALQKVLIPAEKNGEYWSLRSSIFLSELTLPKTTADAGDMLWMLLENQQMIKPAKIKVRSHDIEKEMEGIKEKVKGYFSGLGKKDDELKNAVDSIFNIIDGSIGMIHKLNDKKTTANFAEIMRRCYLDHHHAAPAGLNFFIELGLEVIADLVEKKDPPDWYEVMAITVMGVAQMVAGVIIKAYLPIAGDLIGGALISSGMDDVMFAITSAVTGEFSWADYSKHKEASLKRSIISSAIGCGISFGVSAVQLGSVEKAFDIQKMSNVDKMAKAAHVTTAAFNQTFNLGAHIATEMGKNFLGMGISQIASRGLEGMSGIIASTHEKDVRNGIERAVNGYWDQVVAQADALYEKCGGEAAVIGYVKECVKIAMKKLQEENGLEGVVRESKQVLPQASAAIADRGWSSFVSYVPDIAKLGISLPKLTSLVDNNVRQLMREIRDTRERKEAKHADNLDKTEYHKQLVTVKEEYTKQLVAAFNQTLNSSVYAPLVSMGTTFLIQKGKDALFPMSEQEQVSKSAKTLSDIIETEKDTGKAYYDESLRKWRGATNEVAELSEKELEATPENGGAAIKTLKLQYGSLLKVYKDSEGHLFVQRPTREEYAKGIREGKASGDPELAALSQVVGKNIELKTPDGKVKIFTPDGKMNAPGSQPAIRLDYELNSETGIGHVAGAKSAIGYDCLYEAVIEKEGLKENIQQLREKTASALETEGGKRFYHDWSLQSSEKEFMGMGKRGVYEYAGQQIATGITQGVGAGLLLPTAPLSLGASIFAAGLLGVDAVDHLYAGARSIYTGQIEDTYFTQHLQNDWNGVQQIATGVAEGLGAGVLYAQVPLTGGLSAFPATFLGVDGWDRINAGVSSIYTGQKVDTYFSQNLQYHYHLSRENADLANDIWSSGVELGCHAASSFLADAKISVGNERGSLEITRKKIDADELLKDLDSIANKGLEPAKNGLTNSGFASQKHGDRVGSSFPMANGEFKTVPNQKTGSISRAQRDTHGQFHLEEILTHPNKRVIEGTNRIQIFTPDGRGIMLKQDKTFYFIEWEKKCSVK